jgi:hypothetical protein
MNVGRAATRLWLVVFVVFLAAGFMLPASAMALDFSGTGSQAVGPFYLSGGLTVFSWDQTSGGFNNFIVYLVSGTGEEIALLANELGNASAGSSVVQSHGGILPPGEYRINVSATGNWNLHIAPVTAGYAATPSFAGAGSAAVGPFYLGGGPVVFTWNQTSGGFENFIVYLVDNSGATVDLVANELGATSSGSKVVSPYGGLKPGRYMLAVEAVGSWNMSLSAPITISTTAASAKTGQVPILSGTLTPSAAIGRNMVAMVMKPGKKYWTYSSNRTVYSRNGVPSWQYKYFFKPGMTKGIYKFKAVLPAGAGYEASTSPSYVTIRLR